MMQRQAIDRAATIAAELLSLANACGVFKAFIDGEMWSFET